MQQTYCQWGEHRFGVHDRQAQWNDVPGIYVFAKPANLYQWEALYIGQAASFKDRFTDHERWDEAARRGAVHIHALVVDRAASRDEIERNLIQMYQPPMNKQLKSPTLAQLARPATGGVRMPTLLDLAGPLGGIQPPTAPGSDFMKQIAALGILGGLGSEPKPSPHRTGLLGMIDSTLGDSSSKAR